MNLHTNIFCLRILQLIKAEETYDYVDDPVFCAKQCTFCLVAFNM